MMEKSLSSFFVWLLAGIPVALAAEPLTQWTSATVPSGGTLMRLAYGPGGFVADARTDGNTGWIMGSTNGLEWVRLVGPGSPMYLFTYGRGQFLAVSGDTLVSLDGLRWLGVGAGPGFVPYGLSYGRGAFWAVGEQGQVARSSDGLAWQLQPFRTNTVFLGVAVGHGRLVAVGPYNGPGYPSSIFSSDDGANWEPAPLPGFGFFNGVVYGSGCFVAVNGAGLVSASADGRIWSTQQISSKALLGVAYGSGTFVTVGDGGELLASADGRQWERRVSGTTRLLTSVAFGGGRFVGVGEGGTVLRSGMLLAHVSAPQLRLDDTSRLADGTMLVTVEAPYGREVQVEASADLVNWKEIARDLCERGEFEVYDEGAKDLEQRFYRAWQAPPGWVPPPLEDWRFVTVDPVYAVSDLAYGHGAFVATTLSDTYSTTNLVQWVRTVHLDVGQRKVDYVAGEFVARRFGWYLSMDGFQWASTRAPTDMHSIAWWRGQLWASGARWSDDFRPRIVGWNWWSSPDLRAWVSNGVDQVCQGGQLTGGNGVLVAVHSSGKSISVSEDGLAWQTFTNENWPKLEGLTYGNGRFVAVGSRTNETEVQAMSLVSRNGRDWTSFEAPAASALHGVTYGNKTFVAYGAGGALLTSEDGANWTSHGQAAVLDSMSGVFGDGRFVVGGDWVLYSGQMTSAVTEARVVAELTRRLSDGTMLVTVEGPYGKEVVVESTTDNVEWVEVARDPCDRGEFEVYDETAKDGKPRTYRVR